MQPLTDTQSANGDYARYILIPTDKINEEGQPIAVVQEYKSETFWETVTFPISDSGDQTRLEEIARKVEETDALQEFFNDNGIFEWHFFPMNSRSVAIGVLY